MKDIFEEVSKIENALRETGNGVLVAACTTALAVDDVGELIEYIGKDLDGLRLPKDVCDTLPPSLVTSATKFANRVGAVPQYINIVWPSFLTNTLYDNTKGVDRDGNLIVKGKAQFFVFDPYEQDYMERRLPIAEKFLDSFLPYLPAVSRFICNKVGYTEPLIDNELHLTVAVEYAKYDGIKDKDLVKVLPRYLGMVASVPSEERLKRLLFRKATHKVPSGSFDFRQ